MTAKMKIGIGSLLALLGVSGIILGSAFGLSHLDPPWSFIIGFTFGIISGIGTPLTISSMIEYRRIR
jgi:hypothetical protein